MAFRPTPRSSTTAAPSATPLPPWRKVSRPCKRITGLPPGLRPTRASHSSTGCSGRASRRRTCLLTTEPATATSARGIAELRRGLSAVTASSAFHLVRRALLPTRPHPSRPKERVARWELGGHRSRMPMLQQVVLQKPPAARWRGTPTISPAPDSCCQSARSGSTTCGFACESRAPQEAPQKCNSGSTTLRPELSSAQPPSSQIRPRPAMCGYERPQPSTGRQARATP